MSALSIGLLLDSMSDNLKFTQGIDPRKNIKVNARATRSRKPNCLCYNELWYIMDIVDIDYTVETKEMFHDLEMRSDNFEEK